jgi:arsenate reductase-like glutaredoxin family protein
MKAQEIIRKGEADYKENFKGKDLSEDQWIDAMLKYPKLIERPMLSKVKRQLLVGHRKMFLNFCKLKKPSSKSGRFLKYC